MKRVRTVSFMSEHGNIVVRDDSGAMHASLTRYLPGKLSISSGGGVSFCASVRDIGSLAKLLRECADEMEKLRAAAQQQLKEWEMEEGNDTDICTD